MDYIAVPVVPEILRAKVAVFVDLYRKTRDVLRLNAKLQRQAHLLDQSYDAIFAWRLGNGIVYWNKAAEQLYGYTATEALGRVSHQLLATEYPVSHSELLAALELKENWAGELVHRHRDGHRLMIESRMRLVRSEKDALVLEVNRDITQRKELEREVLEVVSQEQHRIGQELHDGVNQELFALNLISTALSLRLAKVTPHEEKQAARITEGLTRVQRQIRALARGLVPFELDPEGLHAALEDLAERTSEHSDVVCKLDRLAPVQIEDSVVATHLFCIAQEAIRNAVRHSQSRSIRLSLQQSAGRVVLSICDDGKGLPADLNEPTGLGIRLMQHRASLISGWLTVGPAKGGGTIVTCTLPAKNRNGDGDQNTEATAESRSLWSDDAPRNVLVSRNVDRTTCPTI
jgi:PAS domain S-box-containing protein